MAKDRVTYIRILERSVESVEKVAETPDAVFSGELIEENYLTGTAGRNADGLLFRSAVTGITVKGRLLLEDLREKEREQSWAGYLEKFGLFALGILTGALVPVLAAWIKARLHLAP